MKLYQILGEEDDEIGLIYTDTSADVVKAMWSKIYSEDEPEDGSYMEVLEEKLSEKYQTQIIYIESYIKP